MERVRKRDGEDTSKKGQRKERDDECISNERDGVQKNPAGRERESVCELSIISYR